VSWQKLAAGDIAVGDRLRTPSGEEMTVTRIDTSFLGRPEMLAFVEDSDARWIKMPAMPDAELDVLRAGAPA
jgi:hypothetical protein